ncbi:hypothetical protein IWZ00DRAFT_484225 [Phyllosticta capitalensis]|uniref:Uncharacterized protein n=1 Tax=Phyllosticta capitalensis TaxID=121624 RepID=A0ABR1Z177_9PEZI
MSPHRQVVCAAPRASLLATDARPGTTCREDMCEEQPRPIRRLQCREAHRARRAKQCSCGSPGKTKARDVAAVGGTTWELLFVDDKRHGGQGMMEVSRSAGSKRSACARPRDSGTLFPEPGPMFSPDKTR